MLEIIYSIYEVTNGEIFTNNRKSDKKKISNYSQTVTLVLA